MGNPHATFTLVTAVYNSARFLPDYLDSLAALAGGLGDVELLFISDGSPDESDEIIEAWITRTGAPARLIRKEHGGSASARNLGLDLARGTWVSFPDPDDALGVGYLAAVRRFLDSDSGEASSVAAIATKVLQFSESPSDALDNHILGYRYHDGAKCVHLDRTPRFFHTHAPSGFYRTALINKAGLRLDRRLRAAFEDAAFVAEYMLGLEDPVLGVVPDAEYAYRRRPDSVSGSMWSKPERYTTIVEHGYLRILRLRAQPPLWLQNLVLYDLIGNFYEYERPGSPSRTIDRDVAATFLELLDEVLQLIDEQAIYAYSLHELPLHMRTALAARKTGRLLRPEARLTSDGEARRTRISFFTLPQEIDEKHVTVTVDGLAQPPLHATARTIEYYGEAFLAEHELAVDASGTVVVEVDGEVLPLTERRSGTGAIFPWELPARTGVARSILSAVGRRVVRGGTRLRAALAARRAESRRARSG
jgi:glycosyltransferase involved in cell wall biosynthesis